MITFLFNLASTNGKLDYIEWVKKFISTHKQHYESQAQQEKLPPFTPSVAFGILVDQLNNHRQEFLKAVSRDPSNPATEFTPAPEMRSLTRLFMEVAEEMLVKEIPSRQQFKVPTPEHQFGSITYIARNQELAQQFANDFLADWANHEDWVKRYTFYGPATKPDPHVYVFPIRVFI